jgi:hypothetical protein
MLKLRESSGLFRPSAGMRSGWSTWQAVSTVNAAGGWLGLDAAPASEASAMAAISDMFGSST